MLNPGTVYQPRKLPFAIIPVVSAKLDQLEINGMIERISHSDWTTAIVVVHKCTRKVRICGELVTLNPVLK